MVAANQQSLSVSGPSPSQSQPSPTPTPTNPAPSPQPQLRKMRIMPLGDSITYGYGSASCSSAGGCGGYRTSLYSILTSENIAFEFVGSQQNGPSSLPDKHHEGHQGWRIDQISANINAWLTQSVPDVVLLHIGTNDIVQKYDLPNAGARLEHLINLILASVPNVYIFVAYVIPIQNSPDGWDPLVQNYNSAIDSMLRRYQSQNKKVFGANMYPSFNQNATSADYADSVHPADAGYTKMAEIWNGSMYFNGLPTISN